MTTLATNGVRLRYIREGTGPPVVFLHGYLFGADWWQPQIDAIKDQFDAVAVDLRGQMQSETTEDGYDLWNQAEDIHGLLQQLGVAPAHLVGLSMGGMIAMRLALAHPDDVRSLVLMDTSGRPEDPEKVERYEGMRQVVEAGNLEATLPALPGIFLADDFIQNQAATVDGWLAALRASEPMGLVRTGRAVDARDDISGRLGEIQVPTLVIHGLEDVPIPLEEAEVMARGIPGARLETVSGGHQSNVDRPEDTSRLIREFLDAVQARSSAPA